VEHVASVLRSAALVGAQPTPPTPPGRVGRRRTAGVIRAPVAIAVQAIRAGKLPRSEAGLFDGLCAAAHAMRVGKRPAALFWWLVERPACSWVVVDDEDAASELRKRLRLTIAEAIR